MQARQPARPRPGKPQLQANSYCVPLSVLKKTAIKRAASRVGDFYLSFAQNSTIPSWLLFQEGAAPPPLNRPGNPVPRIFQASNFRVSASLLVGTCARRSFNAVSMGLCSTGVSSKRISAVSPCRSFVRFLFPQPDSQFPTRAFQAWAIATNSASENGLNVSLFWFVSSTYFFMEWTTTIKGGPQRVQYLSIFSAS